jgi:hypothetical protein
MKPKQIIRGRTWSIEATAYSKWTGDVQTSQVMNLAGATIKGYFKERPTDLDTAVILNVVGAAVVAGDGTLIVSVTADQTRDLKLAKLFFEIVVKVGATEVSTGIEEVEILQNVWKGAIA